MNIEHSFIETCQLSGANDLAFCCNTLLSKGLVLLGSYSRGREGPSSVRFCKDKVLTGHANVVHQSAEPIDEEISGFYAQ
jgi:hypothetical protein